MVQKRGMQSNPLAKLIRKTESISDGKKIIHVPLNSIFPDPNQPRKTFSEESLQELMESIKEHGFIHLINVIEVDKNKYQIITGERRYYAAKKLELSEIPVVVYDKKDSQTISLLQIEENLNRENLSTVEEFFALYNLKNKFKLKNKDLCELVKKSKAYISSLMAIEKVSEEILTEIREKNISIGMNELYEIAKLEKKEQKEVWEKVKENPTRSNITRAILSLTTEVKKQPKYNDIDAKIVTQAFQKAIAKEPNWVLKFLTRKQVEKLLQDFGE